MWHYHETEIWPQGVLIGQFFDPLHDKQKYNVESEPAEDGKSQGI